MLDGKRAVVADPGSAGTIESGGGEVVAAIGPEGGFIRNEIDMLEKAGFPPVSLGPRILHVEAAVPALLATLG